MSETKSFDVTSAGWVQVGAGHSSVTIQLIGPKPVFVHIGAAAPALDTADWFLMSANGPNPRTIIPLSGLVGDNVYVRAVDNPAVVKVVRAI